jgi:D-glycero-D-manno-heptose 1,7-bisphosphate phosphatase
MIYVTLVNSSLLKSFEQYCFVWNISFKAKIIDSQKINQEVCGLYISDLSFTKIDLPRFIEQAKKNNLSRARTIENDAWVLLGVFFSNKNEKISEIEKTENYISAPTHKTELTPTQMRPALFLDRDGILNQDDAYVFKKEDFVFYEDVVQLIAWARARKYWVFVLTNQSGIGKGLYSEKEFWEFNTLIEEKLASYQLTLDQIYFSPYHIDSQNDFYCRDSLTRKPSPGMLFMAAHDYPINFNESVMVGDKKSDILEFSGIKYFVKRSKYTDGSGLTSGAVAVNNLHEVVEHLK